MNEDLWGALSVTLGFLMGFWNGWIWREIVARRRLRQINAEWEHRLHHVRSHPNGGTWPYAKPICECGPVGRQSPADPRSTDSP